MVDSNLMEIIQTLPEDKVDMLSQIALILKGEKVEKVVEEPQRKWVSTEEAAKTLGVTSPTIRSYINNGTLVGRKLSARKMVVSSDSVQRMYMAQTKF